MSLPPAFQSNVNLAPFTTFGVPCRAAQYARIDSEKQLLQLAGPGLKGQRVLVLGGGSNVLMPEHFGGLVLHMATQGIGVVQQDAGHVWVQAAAGENWHRLVQYCVQRGWWGIENLALIPGSVGAAPIQNIGAYGRELEEVFDHLWALDLHTGQRLRFGHGEARFAYRHSVFKEFPAGRYAIVQVVLRLSKSAKPQLDYGPVRQQVEAQLHLKGLPEPTPGLVAEVVEAIRRSKLPDPATVGNAGSFFKNPVVSTEQAAALKEQYPGMPSFEAPGGVKLAAGWLVEHSGWKGRSLGRAGTWPQQALVLVNHGGATGTEVLQLARAIAHDVQLRFGVSLVPEVNIFVE